MKKILLVACVAVMAFASCGNKTTPAEAVDSVEVEATVDNAADEALALVATQLEGTDANALKAALANLQATYAALVEAGDLEGAKAFALKIQEFVAEKSEAIKNLANGEATILGLVDGIKNLPTSAEATAEEALAAVQADAKTLAEGAKEAAKAAVEAKVEEAKAAAVEKATEAVAPAVEKAAEAAQKAAEAKAKADEKVEQAKAVNDAAKKLLGK